VDQLIVEGKTGMFFDSDDPNSIAETLALALTDRDLLETALTAGPQLVKNEFSIESALASLLPVYDRLLGHK
jgi:hypothetical protein